MSNTHVRWIWLVLAVQAAVLLTICLRAPAERTDPPAAIPQVTLRTIEQRLTELESTLATDAPLEAPSTGRQERVPVREATVAAQARDAGLERRVRKLEQTVAKLLQPNSSQNTLSSFLAQPQGAHHALTRAAASNDRTTALALLAQGAELEKPGPRGMAALTTAIERGHDQLALELIRRGANPNALDEGGETPLMWAAFRGQPKVVRRLIQSGAGVNIRAKTGNTALHDAVRAGNVEIIELLLQRGASVNHKDRSGKTPLTLARQKGNDAVIALLRRYGAR